MALFFFAKYTQPLMNTIHNLERSTNYGSSKNREFQT